ALEVGEEPLHVVLGVGPLFNAEQGADERFQESLQTGQHPSQQTGLDFRVRQKLLQADLKTTLHDQPPPSGPNTQSYCTQSHYTPVASRHRKNSRPRHGNGEPAHAGTGRKRQPWSTSQWAPDWCCPSR